MRWSLLALGYAACTPTASVTSASAPAAPEPDLTIEVSEPWTEVPAGPGERAFRFQDSPHGVRVAVAPGDLFARPGVGLVVDGRTTGAPLVGVSAAVGPPTALHIGSEGYDLLVRFASTPLSQLSDEPDAPNDPALTWVRIRPRNGSWRIVVDGLADIAIPADSVGVGDAGQVTLSGPSGAFLLSTDAPVTTTRVDGTSWRLDTAPSLKARAPYPRTGITWQPTAPIR